MSIVFLTDTIINPDVEKEILGDAISTEFDPHARILIVWNDIVNSSYIDRFTHLKSIIRCGIGFDLIDIEYAKSKNISVSNVPDYCVNEVADTAIAFILNIIRGISRMDSLSKKIASGWQQHLLQSMRRTSSQIVGIIGAGRIGSNTLKKLHALGLECLYYDPYLANDIAAQLPGKRVNDLSELLAKSDIVSLHTPLTKETHGFFNEDLIKKMKPGASLVNTARGKIIKNMELIIQYLENGHLSHVAFDVIPDEPPLNTSLIKAWREGDPTLDGRVLINPHAAFYSVESYLEVRAKAALNAKRVLAGEKQLNVVN